MSYTPTSAAGTGFGGQQSGSGIIDDREYGQRIKIVKDLYPYMADRPDLLTSIAGMPYDTETLVSLSGQAYAMQAGDGFANQLKGYSPAAQRAIVNRLTPGQQQGLAQLGYAPPNRDNGGLSALVGDIAHVVAAPLGVISKGALAIPGLKDTVGGALEGLQWMGNWPGHIYRTVRTSSNHAQVAGLLGGLAGGLAVALAVPTAGASLGTFAALSLIGGGALAGGAAASLGESAAESELDSSSLTNPGDWFRAFNASWHGEKTFQIGAQRKAESLLSDPRLSGLAADLSGQGVDVVELAHELAGHRGLDQNSQLKAIESIASTMAPGNTPQHKAAVTSMINALQDPTFQEAVQTLNNGKISPGRDLADVIGLDPGTTAFNVVSGITDAVFTVTMDPTLMLGYGSKLYKAKKYTFGAFEGGSDVASSFAKFLADRPAAMRTYDNLASVVAVGDRGGTQLLMQRAPQLVPLYGDLVPHAQMLVDTGAIGSLSEFTGTHIAQYLSGKTNLRPILEGLGSVKNARGVQLTTTSIPKAALREFRGNVRSFVNGLADVATENKGRRLASKAGLDWHEQVLKQVNELARRQGREFQDVLPTLLDDGITEQGLIDRSWRFFDEANPKAYRAGRLLGAEGAPVWGRSIGSVGRALTKMTTMSLSGSNIALVGREAPKHIKALAELGEFAGMPSWARHAWEDVMINAKSIGERESAVHGWLANMIRTTGIDRTKEGAAIVDEFLARSKQMFGASDTMLVNGHPMHVGIFLNDQATHMRIPDLHAIRKAAVLGGLGKAMGLSDLPIIEAAMNKVWKPLILLRIGFIPRAAGEEAASFLLRGGFGSLIHEGAGRYMGTGQAYAEAQALKATAQANGNRLIVLTKEQQSLIDKGAYSLLPNHAKPIARIMAHIGVGEDPAMHKLLDYAGWLRDKLGTGFGRADLAYGHEAARVAAAFGNPGASTLARLNVGQFADTILLGNPYSLRRMITGGVHENMVEAGREWASGASTTVMRELSAINAGPIDPGFDHSKAYRTLEIDHNGKLRPITMHVERGQRVTYAMGDPLAEKALMNDLHRTLTDPVAREVAFKYLARVKGSTSVDETQLGVAADHLWAMGRKGDEAAHELGSTVAGAQARHIVTELLGDHSPENWQAMLSEMSRAPSGRHVAEALQTYTKDMAVPDVDGVITALQRARIDLRPNQFDSLVQYRLARRRIDGVTEALAEEAKPMLAWMDGLDLPSRSFASTFLHGQLQDGEQSFWAGQRAAGDAAPTSWLYDSLEDTRGASVDEMQNLALNPHYHDKGATESMRALAVDEQGQLTKPQLRESTVMLYHAPRFPGMNFDQILANATDRNLILENRRTVQAMIDTRAGEANLVADYRLADELHRVDAKIAGLGPEAANRPRLLREDRRVTDGRIHGTLYPDTTSAKGAHTQLWRSPQDIVNQRLVPTPDELLTPTRQWAEDYIGRMHDLVRRGNKQTVMPRFRTGPLDADGIPTQIPLVFRWDGHPVPVKAGEAIDASEINRLVDYKGNPIHYGDPSFFTEPLKETDTGPAGDVMWEFLSNTMRDAWTDARTGTRMRYKENLSNYSLPGRPVQSSDVVPIVRASPLDIKRVPGDDLPRHVIGEILNHQKVGKLESMITYGFDRVIGPSIDALIRRPMAFHHFANRYINAKEALNWTLDPALVSGVSEIMHSYSAAHDVVDATALAESARTLAGFQGDELAKTWTTDHALAWLRGHSAGDIDTLVTKTASIAAHETGLEARRAAAAAKHLSGYTPQQIRTIASVSDNPAATLDAIISQLPNEALRTIERLKPEELRMLAKPDHSLGQIVNEATDVDPTFIDRPYIQELKDAIDASPLLQHITKNQQWDTVIAANTNLVHQRQAAGEIASVAAINDAMPFIDSHEFKTQFADWGKGYAPFWYAEENFMKRWARGLADAGPSVIRRAQLTYMGLKSAGVFRTDQSGRDWFVAPGSGFVTEALSHIPGMEAMQGMGIMFATPTDQLLPGLNNRFGAPSFNPLVTLPAEFVTALFPELAPIDRAVLGDYVSGRGVLDQIVPAHLRNGFNAMFNANESNARYSSALVTAISFHAAHGDDPGPGATPAAVDKYMDEIRRQARVIVAVQAIGGFLSPGSLTEIAAGNSANIAGINVDNPADYLASQYLTLVRGLGIEEGTQKFLELNKNAALEDLINPPGQITPGNIDLANRPKVKNPDGTISTVRSITIGIDNGQAVLIPTVVGNKVVSNEQAIQHWRDTGENLGTFKDEASATAFGQQVHNQQEAAMHHDNAGVVNPLAYTTPKYSSPSGAPIPSTEVALSYINQNEDYFGEFPNAAPWLIPQLYDASVGRSQYAFDQQVIDGLRNKRTPEELYTAIKFKQGAQEYFAIRDAYQTNIEQATQANNKRLADSIRVEMDWKLAIYRTAHPVFADALQSSDGRERRARVLTEMRTVVDDPQHPDTPHFDALALAMHTFDHYQTRLTVLHNDHSQQGRREVDHLKAQYSALMESLVANNPAISSFWVGVLKPESELT